MKVPKAKKLPSGRWRVQIMLDGQRHSFTGYTKREAEEAAVMVKLERQNAAQVRAGDLTLEAAIDKYIKARSRILSPSTIRGYETIKRNRFKSVMKLPLRSVRNWQKVLNDENVSAKTLKNSWGLVRSVLSEAGIDPGPVTLPMVIPADRAFLDPDQVKIFLKAIEGDPNEIAYLLCLHGLRRSEMLAIEKADVSDVIRVSKSRVPDADHKFVTKNTTKNVTSSRSVPIFVDRLPDLVAACPDGPLVLANPELLNDKLKVICSDHGLSEITLHELRHTFVSLMYHLGISEMQAMEFGGYADLTTMRKIYTHLASADRAAAASKLREFARS